jgi:hypothetical protein
LSNALVFSRDPGATQQLIAFLKALAELSGADDAAGLAAMRKEWRACVDRVLVYSRSPGLELWRQAGFSPRPWAGADDQAARALVHESSAKMVVTGTSDIDEPFDRLLWRSARAAGIHSHVVLDQCVNLMQRFVDADGSVTFPDWVYVPNREYADAMADLGMSRSGIRVIGNVYLAHIARRFSELAPAGVTELRTAWDPTGRRQLILFVSECGREMAAAGRPVQHDEIAELESFIDALEAGRHPAASASPGDICLVVRPHPRDRVGKYDSYVGSRPSGLTIVASAAGEALSAVAAADMVVGLNSSLLHEATALGRPAMSLTGHPLARIIGSAG